MRVFKTEKLMRQKFRSKCETLVERKVLFFLLNCKLRAHFQRRHGFKIRYLDATSECFENVMLKRNGSWLSKVVLYIHILLVIFVFERYPFRIVSNADIHTHFHIHTFILYETWIKYCDFISESLVSNESNEGIEHCIPKLNFLLVFY